MLRIGFVCPTYNAVELDRYTRRALVSFFDTTPYGVAIVVDDASPGWTKNYAHSLQTIVADYPGSELHIIRFDHPGGLTRSWNAGLELADKLDLTYAISGNNDVSFTSQWYSGMVHALAHGYDLVGPLSNAPGVTAQGLQEVARYCENYRRTDNQAQLNQMAATLYQKYLGQVVESPVNGFFHMATLASWRRGKYDDTHYYCPYNAVRPSGKINPTPLLTGNEDELQYRWRRQGMQSAIVLSSFIFHYRAVSRGDAYKRGDWYRQP